MQALESLGAFWLLQRQVKVKKHAKSGKKGKDNKPRPKAQTPKPYKQLSIKFGV